MAKLQAVSGCLLVFVACCNAHLCLLRPLQRGPPLEDTLNTPGSNLCIRLKEPCGGEPESKDFVTVRPGKFQVMFQKNLNHYNASLTSHGYFSISLLTGDGTSKTLGHIPDSTDQSLHIYTTEVNLPDLKHQGIQDGAAQIQVVYFTKNPSAPPAFYQCADINIDD